MPFHAEIYFPCNNNFECNYERYNYSFDQAVGDKQSLIWCPFPGQLYDYETRQALSEHYNAFCVGVLGENEGTAIYGISQQSVIEADPTKSVEQIVFIREGFWRQFIIDLGNNMDIVLYVDHTSEKTSHFAAMCDANPSKIAIT